MSNGKPDEYPVIWLQAAACTGCLVSVINSVSPTARNLLVDEVLPGKHLSMRFNPTIMAGQGEAVIDVLDETAALDRDGYILVVDGSIPTADEGAYGSVGDDADGPVSMMRRVEQMGANAMAVIAVGTCSSYGGIPAGTPNTTACVGVKEFLEERGVATPVINVPGCPPHPDWFVGTVATVLLSGPPAPEDLDEVGRPKAFYGSLIHDNCPRRGFFDVGKFAEKWGDPGCLLKLGCKGYVTYADCPTRMWNGGVNWCIGCGGGCIGCVEPEFPDALAPIYEVMSEGVIPALRRNPDDGALMASLWRRQD